MDSFDISHLKSLPESLEVFYSDKITSTMTNHRQLIRQSIADTISQKGFEVSDQLFDLSQLPKNEHFNISLSHCKSSSGFALIDKKYAIGFDVEEQNRSNEKLIQRIAQPAEILKTQDPKTLLSAKEACWKAVSESRGIATISQIETKNWKLTTQNWSEFSAQFDKKAIEGRGFVTEHSGIYISFYISPSTFV